MSEQDYDFLNEIINYLVLCNNRDCSYVVREEIWRISNELIDYRDLTMEKTARPPENEEEHWMIDRMRIGIEKNKNSN